MSKKLDRKKIVPRYKGVAFLMVLVALVILWRIVYVVAVEQDYWLRVEARLKNDSLDIKPTRGNILSCDGRLMAGSLPEYKLFIDFKVVAEQNDSLWHDRLDTLCRCLADIFPDKTAADFRSHLQEGRQRESRHWPIYRQRVAHDVYAEVRQLPIFSLPSYKGGFHVETYNARQRPFGSLAQRTIGDMYGAIDSARCGLELSYDSILRGHAGRMRTQRVRNKTLEFVIQEAENGADIVTTIDVDIQDLAERALLDKLVEINANVGVAIVMEVATGDVKAMVNLSRVAGGYAETMNHAVSDLLEPGSVFKTASLLVALDDESNHLDTTRMVETGSGVWDMYSSPMRDHNWHRGGYGLISLPRCLEVSSNIGVSRIIDGLCARRRGAFVEGITKLGLRDDLKLPFVGSATPKIRMPQKNSKGQYVNWSKTALPWMSIGYETQIPPISTLTFYNAIANGGKMVRPRFVTQIQKDGIVVKEYPGEVMREQIAKPATIQTMQTILEHVVSQGLGKQAGSPSFKVAGKTGTAQVSKGAGGYKSGQVNYLVSFAGFFPADKPRYSCIVCIQKSGLPASGGGQCGPVFRKIAEGVMSQSIKLNVKDAADTTSVLHHTDNQGDKLKDSYVLGKLGVPNTATAGSKASAASKTALSVVPNVVGMGARDAVYALESRGVTVVVKGRGKVAEQSLAAGSAVKKGSRCTIRLEN